MGERVRGRNHVVGSRLRSQSLELDTSCRLDAVLAMRLHPGQRGTPHDYQTDPARQLLRFATPVAFLHGRFGDTEPVKLYNGRFAFLKFLFLKYLFRSSERFFLLDAPLAAKTNLLRHAIAKTVLAACPPKKTRGVKPPSDCCDYAVVFAKNF